MWQKLKEQIPAIVVTAGLVIAAAAFMVRGIVQRQQAELAPLRARNERLAAQADENRRQIAATMTLVKDSLARSGGAGFAPVSSVEKIDEQRLARLAQVIAERVIPAIPAPQSPAEVAAAQNAQVDHVATRLADNIKPVLARAMADQQASAVTAVQAGERRVQQVNLGLMATQAAAQDALRLAQEVSALYADSTKDQGVLMRLFSLPASLVMDAANLNFVATDRAKLQRELSGKVAEIEARLKEVQALAKDSAP